MVVEVICGLLPFIPGCTVAPVVADIPVLGAQVKVAPALVAVSVSLVPATKGQPVLLAPHIGILPPVIVTVGNPVGVSCTPGVFCV